MHAPVSFSCLRMVSQAAHLVNNEHNVVLITNFPEARQEARRGGKEAAFPLNRLDDDGCCISWSTGLLQHPGHSV